MKLAKLSDLISHGTSTNRLTNHQLINQASGDSEKFTPPKIIEAARVVMPVIHLDPASCEKANQTVRAVRFFAKSDDGLSKPWVADNVWMNHPYGKRERACKDDCTKKKCQERGYCVTEDVPGNEDWINKLIEAFRAGHVKQALALTFASTSERWFQPLLDFPHCLLKKRVSHILPSGEPQHGTTKGSCVTYLGTNVKLFNTTFKHLGKVRVPFADM